MPTLLQNPLPRPLLMACCYQHHLKRHWWCLYHCISSVTIAPAAAVTSRAVDSTPLLPSNPNVFLLTLPLLHHNHPSMPSLPLWQLDSFVSPIPNPNSIAFPSPPPAYPTFITPATSNSTTLHHHHPHYCHRQIIYSNSRITINRQLIYSNPRTPLSNLKTRTNNLCNEIRCTTWYFRHFKKIQSSVLIATSTDILVETELLIH